MSVMKMDSSRRGATAVLIALGALLLALSPSADAQMGIATTAVRCSPSPVQVGSTTTCTAVVTGITITPVGTVTWSSGGAGSFSPTSATCSLTSGSCTVSYTPSSSASPVTITAIYGGDTNNDGSTGTFSLAVTLTSAPSTTSSTAASSSTTPEFPTGSIAVITLMVMVTVALLSRRPRSNL